MSVRYLPEFVKRPLRALPQYVAVGTRQGEARFRVELCAGRWRVDVTSNHVIAALRPFTLAIELDEAGLGPVLLGDIERTEALSLHFVDLEAGRTVGSLQLERTEVKRIGPARVGFFRVVGHTQHCVPWPYRAWNRWLQNRAARRQSDPANLSMGDSLQPIMIFYIYPRPVVLVSVDDGRHSNIFPMDLIGPLGPDLFSLALRSTSPSVETLKSARRVALSDIGYCDVNTAYALGVHHRQLQMRFDQLPFAIHRSARFDLPVPAIALGVRELEIIDHATMGSHTFFVCRIVAEGTPREGVPLCHTSGMYQYFRTRRRTPLPAAPR